MTYNHKQASEEKYPLIINGKVLQLSEEQVGALIKKKMRGDLAVQKLFEKFELSLDLLDDFRIEIRDLQGRYAETDLESMVLDEMMFKDGYFFRDNWFVCVHELVHLCSRAAEDNAYFNDPEEVLGFVGSVATLLNSGADIDEIFTLIYPRIEFHFHDKKDSREFMRQCIYKAKELLS